MTWAAIFFIRILNWPELKVFMAVSTVTWLFLRKHCPPFNLGDLLSPIIRWYASNQQFSHFMPDRKMHASAQFKGRAKKDCVLLLQDAVCYKNWGLKVDVDSKQLRGTWDTWPHGRKLIKRYSIINIISVPNTTRRGKAKLTRRFGVPLGITKACLWMVIILQAARWKKLIAGEIPSIAPGPFRCQSKPNSAVYLTPPSIFNTYLTDAKSS